MFRRFDSGSKTKKKKIQICRLTWHDKLNCIDLKSPPLLLQQNENKFFFSLEIFEW